MSNFTKLLLTFVIAFVTGFLAFYLFELLFEEGEVVLKPILKQTLALSLIMTGFELIGQLSKK